jgi:hypothetical protein
VILDHLNDVNWAAVGASLVAAFAIGLIWFSPSALGGYWARQVSRYATIPRGEITSGASQPTSLSKWLLGMRSTLWRWHWPRRVWARTRRATGSSLA